MNINGPMPAQPLFAPPVGNTSSVPYVPVAAPSPVVPTQNSTAPVAPLVSTPKSAPVTMPLLPLLPSTRAPTVTGSSNCASHIGQPLFSVQSHQYEPVKTADSMANIRSTAEISDHLDVHHGQPSTMPQIFHPIVQPQISATQPSYQGNLFPVQPVVPIGHISPTPLAPSSVPFQPNPPVGHITPPPPPLNPRTMSPLPSSNPQPQFPVSQMMPPVTGNSADMVGHITPPPPPPTCLTPPMLSSANGSNHTTPRSSSPPNQDKDSSDDSGNEMDDEEGLKATLDALQDVIDKYQESLSVSLSEILKLYHVLVNHSHLLFIILSFSLNIFVWSTFAPQILYATCVKNRKKVHP